MREPAGSPNPGFPRFRRTWRAAILTFAILLSFAWYGAAQAQTYATPKAGWPKTLAGAGPVTDAQPVVADLDNDGPSEVIVATSAGILYVLNSDGTIRTGWPQTLPAKAGSSPAAGDLDRDGFADIVIGYGTNADLLTKPGGVRAFKRNGTMLWDFPARVSSESGLPDHVWSTPAIGDVNGDGFNDVAFGAWDEYLYVLDGLTGNPLTGWPVFLRDTTWSSAALADLDGDGALEILIGGDVHKEGPNIDTDWGGALWVFRKDGSYLAGFPKFLTYPDPGVNGERAVGIRSAPAVGDIDGDGCPEVVVGTSQVAGSPYGKELWAWHSDSRLVTGFPVPLNGQTKASPALANLEGHTNGQLDIVISDEAGWVYGIRGNGTIIFATQPVGSYSETAFPNVVGEVAIAQMTLPAPYGFQNPAILVGSGFDVAILSKTGVQISDNGSHTAGRLTLFTGHPLFGVAVSDIDGTGQKLNVIAASGVDGANTTDARVFVWEIGAPGTIPWAMFRKNAKRDGWVTPAVPKACPRVVPAMKFYGIPPCRIADSRDPGNITWGGPSYVPGEERSITFPSGGCGVPSGATAVALNVTVTRASTDGLVRVYPTGDTVPIASTLNFKAGKTRANNTITALSFDGRGHLTVKTEFSSGTVDVILDVSGYFK